MGQPARESKLDMNITKLPTDLSSNNPRQAVRFPSGFYWKLLGETYVLFDRRGIYRASVSTRCVNAYYRWTSFSGKSPEISETGSCPDIDIAMVFAEASVFRNLKAEDFDSETKEKKTTENDQSESLSRACQTMITAYKSMESLVRYAESVVDGTAPKVDSEPENSVNHLYRVCEKTGDVSIALSSDGVKTPTRIWLVSREAGVDKAFHGQMYYTFDAADKNREDWSDLYPDIKTYSALVTIEKEDVKNASPGA